MPSGLFCFPGCPPAEGILAELPLTEYFCFQAAATRGETYREPVRLAHVANGLRGSKCERGAALNRWARIEVFIASPAAFRFRAYFSLYNSVPSFSPLALFLLWPPVSSCFSLSLFWPAFLLFYLFATAPLHFVPLHPIFLASPPLPSFSSFSPDL